MFDIDFNCIIHSLLVYVLYHWRQLTPSLLEVVTWYVVESTPG